ncbi:MAG: exodeoxyribonuclease VII large subunit [Candidatus Cloacimonetes bacterium]|nr:exodeoxyribonuclease VII large subunit [Candidatus Cloacimonadota bacterium]
MNIKDNVFSVTEVTRHIKNILETNIPNLFVEGEIANFVKHSSGHFYFSLKDSTSSLRCVFFKNLNLYLSFEPRNGDQIICGGKLTVFERNGNYQLNVTRMYPVGIGNLQLRYEELKKKLELEGLFSPEHKQPLPPFPESIGIITSPTGAAFQDIKNVLSRRFPCRIILFPALVQGDKAPADLIAGIKYFNERKNVDLIIIGRGGGSQEDLFCFNDENLARAIYASSLPIISAVGHEIDFSIADFTADLRAPTPSAAAEIAVPASDDLLSYLEGLAHKLRLVTRDQLHQYFRKIDRLLQHLQIYHPEKILQSLHQRLDEASLRLDHQTHRHLKEFINRLQYLQIQLKELSPYDALKRGYSIVRQNRKIISSLTTLNEKELVEILLADGYLKCEIKEIIENIDWENP